jgi:hypothetical protein
MIYRVKVVSYPKYINIDFVKSYYKRDFNIGTIHNVDQADVLKTEGDLITFKFFYFNSENDDTIELKGFVGKIVNRVKQMKDAQCEILTSYYEIKEHYISMHKNYGIIENLQNFQFELHNNIVVNNNNIILNNIDIIKVILINLNIYCTIMLIDDFNNIDEKFKEIHLKGLNLFEKKNTDYGDSFATFGIVGIIIRLEDKINRCISITKNNKTLVEDESIKDTIFDTVNYTTMGIMLINDN